MKPLYEGRVVAGPPPQGSLAAELTRDGFRRWINLRRQTDYLGFRVLDDVNIEVDRVVLETSIPWREGDPQPPPITSHGGYVTDKVYIKAVTELLEIPT